MMRLTNLQRHAHNPKTMTSSKHKRASMVKQVRIMSLPKSHLQSKL